MDGLLYLITTEGLQILVGQEGDEVRKQIDQAIKDTKDLDAQAFQLFDDDRKVWSTWAKLDVDGKVKPVDFLEPDKYGITSAELYAKTTTFATLLAKAIRILTFKAPTLWEKLMKPTTVITAIVLIVMIMIIGVVALQG